MNKEWIKFADQLPEVGQYIWTSSTEAPAVSWMYAERMHIGPYTHWMPCERPDKPLPDKAPEDSALEEYIRTAKNPAMYEIWNAALRWERNRKK